LEKYGETDYTTLLKLLDNKAKALDMEIEHFQSNYFFLSQKGNLKEAAKNLYSTLRKIKKKKYSSIAVCKIPDRGYGKTINDRLLRASRFNEKTT